MPPNKILDAAGNHANLPNETSDISMAGIINDQIDAATIMPPAIPNKNELMLCEMSFLKKNTNDAPNVVIRNMMENPIMVIKMLFIVYLIIINITLLIHQLQWINYLQIT